MQQNEPRPVVVTLKFEDAEVEVDYEAKDISLGSTRGKGTFRRDYMTADQARKLANALVLAADALSEHERPRWP